MNDDSGTHKLKVTDIGKPQRIDQGEGFSKDEIDSLADLIGDETEARPKIDLEDTGPFSR